MMDPITRNRGAAEAPAGAAPSVLVAQVSSDWDWARRAQHFAQAVGRLAAHGGDGADRLGCAVRDLLENAVRYSSGGSVRLSLCADPLTGDFRVQTENQASERDWIRLRDRLAVLTVRGAAAGYRELLADATEQGHEVGLGLGRLAHTARLRVAARVYDRQVHVVAASRAPSFLPPAAIRGTSAEDVALYVSHEGAGDHVLRGASWEDYAKALAGSLCGLDQRSPAMVDLETSGAGRASRATGRWPRCAA